MKKPSPYGHDPQLQTLIDKGLEGDVTVNEALLSHACDRLLYLTRQMLHTQASDLKRWEQTDDVFQNAMIRLHKALADSPVQSVRHFYNLAAVQIRRELIDLARHHFGPHGGGKNHHTDHQPSDEQGGTLYSEVESAQEIEDWTDFHVFVEKLPQEERETVNLIYYEGMTVEQAAEILGIGNSTVRKRWFSARQRISEAIARERER